jgi:hypothetical protein
MAPRRRTKRPLQAYRDRVDAFFFSPAWRDLCSGEVNLAVMLGRRSGGLCTIDFDVDEFGAAWDAVNPQIARATTRTMAARGWQVWLQLLDDFPPSEKTNE